MRMRNELLAMAVIALGVAALGQDARSQGTTPGTFTVTANVANACTLTTLPISFGNITSASVAAVATTVNGIVVNCTADGLYDVGLLGTNTGALANGTGNLLNAAQAPIPYGLFQNAAATTPWGNTAGTNSLSTQGCGGTGTTGLCTGTGAVQNYQVWAKLGTLPSPLHLGAYADIVNVTVTFY
jgi:spore coat protein U-like protein